MIKAIFPLLCILFFACVSDRSGKHSNDNSPSKLEVNTPSDWIKKDACEYVSLSKISELIGWELSQMRMSLSKPISENGQSSCSYQYQKDKLIISLSWREEKSNNQETLENQYSRFLKNQEKGMTFKEIESGDDQSILGYGRDPFGQSLFILKKRRNNALEIEILMANMNAEVEVVEEKLSALAQLFVQMATAK